MLGLLLWPLLGCAVLEPDSELPVEAALSAEAGKVLRIEPPSERPQPVKKVVAPVEKFADRMADAVEPSNDRDWSPDMARLPHAEIDGRRVTVYNIRNCDYHTPDDYEVRYYDRTFDLDRLESVDFIVVPFLASPGLAHVMMSFGFEGDEYVGLSVEIRREKGEKYVPLFGVLRQFELMYVIGDERDLIRQCTDVYLNGVYVYRSNLTREEGRALFVDVMRRANQLANRPEFYHTFANNCTTNIVRHINRLGTRKLPYNHQVIFPGKFDELLYDRGLISGDVSFAQARLRARVNLSAYLHSDSAEYSSKIRQ